MTTKKVLAVKSDNTAYAWDIHNYLQVIAFDVNRAVRDLSIPKQNLGVTQFDYHDLLAGEGVADTIKNNLKNASFPGLSDIFQLDDGKWMFFVML
tara:strand:+ start:576 stop:860 length:285 start_codon:yes stop_codon:yes gene_type:complete